MKNILFVINPKAGHGRAKAFPALVKKLTGGSGTFAFLVWEDSAQDLAAAVKTMMQQQRFDTVVAVGGDGTVNIVATVVTGTDAALGIIPYGSGNGLARFLKISLNPAKALQTILDGKKMRMDFGKMNQRNFFCTCGVGFDAHVGHVFAQQSRRGFFTYLRITIVEYFRYKKKEYVINRDGEEIIRKAFLITVANADQFGGNVYIAPGAKIDDGLLNVTVIRKANFLQALTLAVRILTGSLNKSPFVETFRVKKISIAPVAGNPDLMYHFDGEPGKKVNEISIECIPGALNVITEIGNFKF